jgi:hypothetical protein
MIESRGIATVTIGLIRPHMERTRPPRGLWVPFPLGRPFGEPADAGFQRRVLQAALDLLERRDGPVVLEDFPDDSPSMADRGAWQPKFVLPSLPAKLPKSADEWMPALEAEMQSLIPTWEGAKRNSGRTMAGNSRLALPEWLPYAAEFFSGNIPESPVEGLSPAVVLRYVADDIKALYYEAAQATAPYPTNRQIENWFWYETLVSDFLRALRAAAIDSDHKGFNVACSRFVVPMPFVERR